MIIDVFLVEVSDLERRLGIPIGSLKGVDLEKAKAAIEDATTLVMSYVKSRKVDSKRLKFLIVQVALRFYLFVYADEEKLDYVSENIGNYGYKRSTWKRKSELLDEERNLLDQLLGLTKIYSVKLTSPYARNTSSTEL